MPFLLLWFSFSAFCWFSKMFYFSFFYLLCNKLFCLNNFACLFACLFLVSQLSHLALQGPNLEPSSLTSSQIANVADSCSDEWPSWHSSWSYRCVYIPNFLRLQLIRNSIPKKTLEEEFHLPIINRGVHPSICHLQNTFSPLYLEATKTSYKNCLFHIQIAATSYLLLYSPFCVSICLLWQRLPFIEASRVSLCIFSPSCFTIGAKMSSWPENSIL